MAYTDVGTTAGVIYDVNEPNRLNDFANQFNDLSEKADSIDVKKKNLIRYGIVGVSAVLILVLLRIAVKKKQK
jgi:hypothetical protein